MLQKLIMAWIAGMLIVSYSTFSKPLPLKFMSKKWPTCRATAAPTLGMLYWTSESTIATSRTSSWAPDCMSRTITTQNRPSMPTAQCTPLPTATFDPKTNFCPKTNFFILFFLSSTIKGVSLRNFILWAYFHGCKVYYRKKAGVAYHSHFSALG